MNKHKANRAKKIERHKRKRKANALKDKIFMLKFGRDRIPAWTKAFRKPRNQG